MFYGLDLRVVGSHWSTAPPSQSKTLSLIVLYIYGEYNDLSQTTTQIVQLYVPQPSLSTFDVMVPFLLLPLTWAAQTRVSLLEASGTWSFGVTKVTCLSVGVYDSSTRQPVV